MCKLGIVLRLAPCFANMKEIKSKMLKIILRHFGRHFQHLIGGARSLCLYHSWFQTGQTFCISVSFFSEVCFFIGTSEAIEVIPSSVGNETAISLSFEPQI